MKGLINIAVLVGVLFGGTMAAREIHDRVRKAALEKAAQGLPSLTGLTSTLRAKKKDIEK